MCAWRGNDILLLYSWGLNVFLFGKIDRFRTNVTGAQNKSAAIAAQRNTIAHLQPGRG
jgi:hypothetical protein